jgi:hypothetical protein
MFHLCTASNSSVTEKMFFVMEWDLGSRKHINTFNFKDIGDEMKDVLNLQGI